MSELKLKEILEHFQKVEYQFKDEKATYIFKQAVAILNHVGLHGDSRYGIDGGYLSEKADKIVNELRRLQVD